MSVVFFYFILPLLIAAIAGIASVVLSFTKWRYSASLPLAAFTTLVGAVFVFCMQGDAAFFLTRWAVLILGIVGIAVVFLQLRE